MIPDYQSLMLPLLKLVSDGQEHKYRDLIESLAIEFQVTDEERKELLASGNQAIFDNRVGWAKTYLKKAGLLDSPKRATFIITDLGRQTLAKNPDYNACNNSNSLSPCLRCRFNRNFIFFLLFMPLHDKLFPESHNSKTDVVFYSYKNQTTLSGNAIIVLRFRDDPNIRIHI